MMIYDDNDRTFFSDQNLLIYLVNTEQIQNTYIRFHSSHALCKFKLQVCMEFMNDGLNENMIDEKIHTYL